MLLFGLQLIMFHFDFGLGCSFAKLQPWLGCKAATKAKGAASQSCNLNQRQDEIWWAVEYKSFQVKFKVTFEITYQFQKRFDGFLCCHNRYLSSHIGGIAWTFFYPSNPCHELCILHKKCPKNSGYAVKTHTQNHFGHPQMTAYPESALSETALAEGWL